MDLTDFIALFAELRACPHVQIHTIHDDLLTLPREIKEFFRAEIQQEARIELDEELVACMDAADAGVWWTYNINQLQGGGEFKLEPLREVFLYKPEPLWSDETPAAEARFLERLRFFDYRPGAGDNKFAAFELASHAAPFPIWYYDRGECYRMQISYAEYLEALVFTKGITDWQYVFCDISRTELKSKGALAAVEKALEALDLLFPQHAYDTYHARLAEK